MSRWRLTATAGVFASCVGAACTRPPAAGDVADLLIRNGKVYTAIDGSIAEAVAVRGNTILRVGSSRDLEALRGPGTEVVDAHGGTVAPGFNDSHVHFLSGGLGLDEVNLGGLTDVKAIQDKIRRSPPLTPTSRGSVAGGGCMHRSPAACLRGSSSTRRFPIAGSDDVLRRPQCLGQFEGPAGCGHHPGRRDPPNGIIVKALARASQRAY